MDNLNGKPNKAKHRLRQSVTFCAKKPHKNRRFTSAVLAALVLK